MGSGGWGGGYQALLPPPSLGPITLEEAWAFRGLSLGSPLVCISAAILGRREQSFSEHLLCTIRHFTVPPGAP